MRIRIMTLGGKVDMDKEEIKAWACHEFGLCGFSFSVKSPDAISGADAIFLIDKLGELTEKPLYALEQIPAETDHEQGAARSSSGEPPPPGQRQPSRPKEMVGACIEGFLISASEGKYPDIDVDKCNAAVQAMLAKADETAIEDLSPVKVRDLYDIVDKTCRKPEEMF